MKSKIFYFSGTGNSLFVAKKINEYLGKGEIVSIPGIINSNEIIINEEVIGIVFPVYSQTYPAILKVFVGKLNFKTNPYIFSIATNGGEPGAANFDIDNLLMQKNKKLNSGFEILMPANSIIIKDCTNPIDVRESRLKNANNKILEISESIIKFTDNQLEVS